MVRKVHFWGWGVGAGNPPLYPRAEQGLLPGFSLPITVPSSEPGMEERDRTGLLPGETVPQASDAVLHAWAVFI